jgi:tetratricopeptide (TPR) repeat protein
VNVNKTVLLCVMLYGWSALAGTGADEHSLAGARSFRAGRFGDALIEFRVAEKMGNREAAWYAAASLVKLKRPQDALEAFAAAERVAPRSRDDLIDYYRATACYEARLYTSADRLLAGIGERAGPRILEEVRRVRSDIARLLRSEPTTATVDWYHWRAGEALQKGRALLAQGYLEEVSVLSARRKDRYRADEARLALARVRGQARPQPETRR